jgi:hypothetical protein
MTSQPPASILARLKRRRMPSAPDPADLGTAFGLDLSLQPPPLAQQAPAQPRHPGWLERLLFRLP